MRGIKQQRALECYLYTVFDLELILVLEILWGFSVVFQIWICFPFHCGGLFDVDILG